MLRYAHQLYGRYIKSFAKRGGSQINNTSVRVWGLIPVSVAAFFMPVWLWWFLLQDVKAPVHTGIENGYHGRLAVRL